MTTREKLRAIRQLVIDDRWTKRTRQNSLSGDMCMLGMACYVDGKDCYETPDQELLKTLADSSGVIVSINTTDAEWAIVQKNDSGQTRKEDMLEWIDRAMDVAPS